MGNRASGQNQLSPPAVPGARRVPRASQAAVPRDLRRLERWFAEQEWPERRVLDSARKRARQRALAALASEEGGEHSMYLLIAAAELVCGMRAELAAQPERIAQLAGQLQELAGLSRITVAREFFRAPELLTLLPATAVNQQLTMLTALAPLRSASLWTLDNAEHVSCMRHIGEGFPSRGAKQLAQRLLTGEIPEPEGRRLLVGLPVGRWGLPSAALIGSARPGQRDRAQVFLAEAVPLLIPILERDALLGGNVESERVLVESSERKLTRLGFDLHDGPIQDVAALADDLRAFKDQLETVVGTTIHRKRVHGRLEDLDAQLGMLDVELRRISNEVHAASVLLKRPFGRALREVAQAFAARTNIEPRLTLEGDLSMLSGSQQIALLNIIQEALTNVREHSEATRVDIAVSANEQSIEAQVTDNGRGFDLEPTLIRAAREGRLGLVAMHERARLLGGQGRIDSRPGGPTVVSVALERWEPLQATQPVGLSA